MGKVIHCYVFRHLKVWDLTRTIALEYMYAKCGDLSLSRNVFDIMPMKDIAWSTRYLQVGCTGMEKNHFFSSRRCYYQGSNPTMLLLFVFDLLVAIPG